MATDYYRLLMDECTEDLILREGQIISSLINNVRDSAIVLSLIPFIGLYCKSSKEYLNISSLDFEFEKYIKDLRNGLKIFTGKYSKGLKMIIESDKEEDEKYRNKLRFSFLKKMNIHNNLGIYFTEQGNIIFNTELGNFYLKTDCKKRPYDIGVALGCEVRHILTKQYGKKDYINESFKFNSVPRYGYIDINSDKNNIVFNHEFDKETNLRLLHMISMIGSVNNLILPVFKDKNTWSLRILYVTVHNVFMGIKQMNNHFSQNKTCKFRNLEIGDELNLLSSGFRNCMMHYNLYDKKGDVSINQRAFDKFLPLYGLVESYNSGMDYETYYDKLYNFAKKLENYLLLYFNVDKSKIRWDWN